MKFKNWLNEKEILDYDFITYDPKLRHDAQFFSLDNIKVGPKFFKLPNKESQKAVLLHELGHYISDVLLKSGKVWEWMDKDYFTVNIKGREIFGLNGKTIPGEILAESFSVIMLEPEFLEKYYNDFYKEFSNELNNSKYKNLIKLANKIKKEL